MTPFGSLLRYFRCDRGMSTRHLATQVGFSQKCICAIEAGRKLPPQGEAFDQICRYLELTNSEKSALLDAARRSHNRLRIPTTATPRHYQLAHRVVESLEQLSSRQIQTIHAVLDELSSEEKREGRTQ